MTPNQLAAAIERLIVEANDQFGVRVIAVESDLYNRLMLTLKGLVTTQDGYILQNAENRKILRKAQNQFDSIISKSSYQAALQSHLLVIPKIDALNQAYFKTVSESFAPNRQFIRSLQSNAIESVNTYVLNDGLASQVRLPINDILNQNINQGGQFSGMQKQLETFIKGSSTTEGRLMQYAKGILRDSLFNYSRSYQQSVVADLGLSWYRYVGGVIDKTREFCSDRNGGFFHQKEIESWAAINWKGKNPLTTESSIFTYCGGYNCVHQLIAVHESAVPQEWMDRFNDLGLAA